MTVNYYVECPTCRKITRMRSPAGYIYSTPVRVHCGNCNTLLTGEFISDEEKYKAYFVPKNCNELKKHNNDIYDYFCEASGEMICRKVSSHESDELEFIESPVFDFMDSLTLEDRENFINYVCFITNVENNWDDERIKFDLYLNNKYDLIGEKYKSDAKSFGYELDSDFEIFRYIYFSIIRNLGGLFNKRELHNKLREINNLFTHTNTKLYNDFVEYLNSNNRIENAEKKLFETFKNFIEIVSFITPAIGVSNYKNSSVIDKERFGISTCSFTDIKNFYQDSYERLVEYSDIIIGLDNIFQRNDYSKCKNGDTIIDFSKKSKGNKIKDIDDIEPLSKLFNIKSNANELRNAIGHADYDYNGFLQTITYKKSFGSEEIVTSYLLDVAMECVNLARSLLIMLFCIYELKRTNYYVDFNTPMPKFMYSGVKGQGRCPCGSGKKYSSCCKNKKVFNYTLYPRRANCYFKVGPNGIELPEGLLEKFIQK